MREVRHNQENIYMGWVCLNGDKVSQLRSFRTLRFRVSKATGHKEECKYY